MPAADLSLAGFTEPELLSLAHQWQYAAGRCRQELAELRRPWPLAPPQRPTLTFQQWASLSQDYRYFTTLARAVETAVAGSLFELDTASPGLALADLLTPNSRPFSAFLERERQRAQLAVAYITWQPFDRPTKQDLLEALALEIRFFNRLLAWASRPGEQLRQPAAAYAPLLFLSLPKPLATAQPQP